MNKREKPRHTHVLTRSIAVLGTGCALLLAGCTSTPASNVAAATDDAASGTGSAASAAGSSGAGSSGKTESAGRQAETSGTTSAAPSSEVAAPISTASTTTAPISTGALRTTAVPAPGGGDINQTVAAVPVTTLPQVALTEPASFGGGVTARITGVQPINTTASGPGEIGGPGVAVSVEIDNSSADPVSVDTVSVTAADSSGSAAVPISGDPARSFAGQVAPGSTASAVYVFTIPEAQRSPIAVQVSYSTEAPIVLFVGDVA